MTKAGHASPLDVAKETLRLLASRRLLPTPDNYRVVYLEIAGGDAGGEPFPKATLSSLTAALPNDTPVQVRLIRELEQFTKQENWPGYKERLISYLSGLVSSQQLNWGSLIAQVVSGLDQQDEGYSRERKLESLERVISNVGAGPDVLYGRVQGLLKAWSTALEFIESETPDEAVEYALEPAPEPRASVRLEVRDDRDEAPVVPPSRNTVVAASNDELPASVAASGKLEPKAKALENNAASMERRELLARELAEGEMAADDKKPNAARNIPLVDDVPPVVAPKAVNVAGPSELPVAESLPSTTTAAPVAAAAPAPVASVPSALAVQAPAPAIAVDVPPQASAPVSSAAHAMTPDLLPGVKGCLIALLNAIGISHTPELPTLAVEAMTLAQTVREARRPEDLRRSLVEVHDFSRRLERSAGDQSELRAGLLGLLRLFAENVSDLVSHDHHVHGQVEIIRQIVDKPMSIQAIDDASLRLKEVISKQTKLNQDLESSRQFMKQLLADFVDQLSGIIDDTSGYSAKMGERARQIAASESIEELSAVIRDIVNETKGMEHSAEQSKSILISAQNRVKESEQKIQALEEELHRTSELVRYDFLTGVFNRRGMEEMLAKEAGRAVRRQSPLCIGLLDLDNFKKLNDSLGHKAGDEALVHLASLCKETIRPQDIVARYGGEEFVVILPDTPLEEASAVLVRLQRELTKRLFLHESQSVLITFSAGVTQWRPDDSEKSALARADAAMYQAKHTGKNKVVMG